MARHVLPSTSATAAPIRLQVSFIRPDLLLGGEAVHPATGEVAGLPIRGEDALIGPSISHCLVRRVVRTDTAPGHHQAAATASNGGIMPEYVAIWTLLDTATLWRTGELPPPREPSGITDDQRKPEHPFKRELVTGGSHTGGLAPDGWVPVRKGGTAWISDGAFRLAAAMHGGADEGAQRIGACAVEAWERDLVRCLDLHALVAGAGPDGLLETVDVLLLRPASSVSQEVEKAVLDEALRWLGVDPAEPMARTAGRRRRAGDDGDTVVVNVDGEGRVQGHLRHAYGGWPEGAVLADIALPRLVELLGRLRTDSRGTDADLLEAYLDAAHPAWRDLAAGESEDATTAADPWEVLGLRQGASWDEVTAAYRSIMKRVHPDVAGLPPWVSRAVADAYRTLKEAA